MTSNTCCRPWLFAVVLLFGRWVPSLAAITELERLEGYHARNYSWPPPKYVPDTPGWTELKARRFTQIANMGSAGDRYQGYATMIKSGFLIANFTELGFGLARAPEEMTALLRKGLFDGLSAVRPEKQLMSYLGPKPWYIDRPDLGVHILMKLKQYAEAWCQIPVIAAQATGYRLYRNTSQLMMHLDEAQANVLSIIYHIGSSEDAEQWPLMIEDYLGRTHEVLLTPGDLLLLEGAKVAHGRPQKFLGSWYANFFLNYFPAGEWGKTDHQQETVFAIPPDWNEDPDEDEPSPYPRMQMIGTGYMEPDCPNSICDSTIKWSGPGKEGVFIDPLFRERPFHLKENTERTEL
jgi:hypothetical protein